MMKWLKKLDNQIEKFLHSPIGIVIGWLLLVFYVWAVTYFVEGS